MMSPRLASCFLVCAIACTRRASSPAEAGGDAAPSSPPPAPARPEELKQMCDAGGLPQIDETAVGAEPLLTAAERGTVALRWDGAHAAFTEGCSLPGAYTELPGSGGGRFFGTDRVTLRVDEVPPSCRGATHLVASFVTWREASVAKSRALLVPLPCPPTGEASPAAGCIGAGLTGAERRARARDSAKRLHADSEETVLTPGDGLSIYALAPDDVLAVDSLRRLRASDFALRAQVDWLKSQYVFEHKPGEELPALVLISRERAPRPRVFDRSLANEYCVPDPGATPGFAYCYPEHFIVDWQGEWKPLHRTP